MLEFENQIFIEKPASQVFAFLADCRNIPRWNYYVVQVDKLTSGEIGVGTTYHQVRKTDEQTFRIVVFEPDERLVLRTTPQSSPQLEMSFGLLPKSAGTQVYDHWQLDTGLPGLVEKVAARKIKKAVAENLEKLKQLMETGQVILQDGRQSLFQQKTT